MPFLAAIMNTAIQGLERSLRTMAAHRVDIVETNHHGDVHRGGGVCGTGSRITTIANFHTTVHGQPVDLPWSCVLKSENQAVCVIFANLNGTKRQRYIDLLHHLLQHLIRQNELRFVHVPAAGQKADMFTKPMKRSMFFSQCQTLRIGTVRRTGGV